MKTNSPKINIYQHDLPPQAQPSFDFNNADSFNNFPTFDQNNSNFNNIHQFSNFSQQFQNPHAMMGPCLNSQINQNECKSSNGIFKNIFKKLKSPPQMQNATQPLNNQFNTQIPYSTSFSPFQFNSFGQPIYPENMCNYMSQPVLNNSGTFYPQQNYLASPSYPDENIYRMQNQQTPGATEEIFSTPLELSKQKFLTNSSPCLETHREAHFEDPSYQAEVIHHLHKDDSIPPSSDVSEQLNVTKNLRKPIPRLHNNGPLSNTINYLLQQNKTTTLDAALKLDNKLNDKKFNKFSSIHKGPKVTNKKSLTIWEIDQLINENYNNRFWKNDLDELVLEKFNFLET